MSTTKVDALDALLTAEPSGISSVVDHPPGTASADAKAYPGSNRLEVGISEKPVRWLARYGLFQVSTQIFEDFLLALLNFKEDRFRHSRVVLPRMDFARLEEDPTEIANALLRD